MPRSNSKRTLSDFNFGKHKSHRSRGRKATAPKQPKEKRDG